MVTDDNKINYFPIIIDSDFFSGNKSTKQTFIVSDNKEDDDDGSSW